LHVGNNGRRFRADRAAPWPTAVICASSRALS